MKFEMQDEMYNQIVNNILQNKKFNELSEIEHHGITRLEHSKKVSYYSYKIAKLMHLDYAETARGGLLHDFFISPNGRSNKDRAISVFVHPKQALDTAKNEFDLSTKEMDMIRSHMFPLNLSVPKYMESWIVSIVDKVVAVNELSVKFKFQVRYAYNVMLLFMIGFIK